MTPPLANRAASTHVPGAFAAPDGVELFEQRWTAPEPVHGHVIVVHGYGEHSSRYGHIAERLTAEGYSVYAYDQRGHGNSPGRTGYVPSFSRLVEDLQAYSGYVFPDPPDEPLFVLGHSMGGLVVVAWALKYSPNVRGLVISSPLLEGGDNVPPIQRKLAPIVARIAPHAPALVLETKALSRIPEVVQRYEDDPLVYHGKIGTRTGYEFMRTIAGVQANLSKLTLPFIVLHGTDDRLAPYAGAEVLYERAGSADKTLKRFDGGYHELFNDLGSEDFFAAVLDWLKSHS